jgi:hypothetical protein
MKLLATDAKEIVATGATFPNNPGQNERALVTQFNDSMIGASPQ